jgi:AcrR family transcriptional regulator
LEVSQVPRSAPNSESTVLEPPRRGRPRDAAAGDAIIEATLAVLAERGYQAATMDAIAAEAGVGKNTIYRRWASKEELVADAIDALGTELATEDGDARTVLLELIRDLGSTFADPRVGRILPGVLGELPRNPTLAHVYADRVVRPRRQAIVELLERASERGELRPDADLDQVADLLVGPPFLRFLLPLGLPEVTDRYAEALLETIWAGIAPRSEPVP